MAHKLDRLFNPRTVAVVGDKRANDYMWLRCQTTFKGKVYSVQIDPQEIPGIEELGFQNYSSLLSIEEPIDYVIVAVPRNVTPRIIADCVKARVGGASLFTSGFSETRTEEGRKLEQEIALIARQGGLNMVGPNCMGVFNPALGLRQDINQYSGMSGQVGFIAQSGTHAIFFSLVGNRHGVNASKTVSFGNAAVLDSTDYLEYLGQDRETKAIGMYLEGVKDGARFFRTLKDVAARKPVLIWNGGRTAEGARAAMCHTGAMASQMAIWESIIAQCGAIRVNNLEEMVDTTKALVYLRPPAGGRVGLVAHSGGQSVVIADAFSREGLQVPMLSDRSYQEFASFYTIIGGSYMNPLDISWNVMDTDGILKSLRIVERDENIDAVVLEVCIPFLSQIWEYDPTYLERLLDALKSYDAECKKTFCIALVAGQKEEEAMQLGERFMKAGMATFPSFERSARAMKKLVQYYGWPGRGAPNGFRKEISI